jgi:hypothetical protein
LNGALRWGIELLVNGPNIGERLNRFEIPHGQYAALGVCDYAVVELRKKRTSDEPTNIARRHPKRVTVSFLADDFKVVEVFFGEDAVPEKITLAD